MLDKRCAASVRLGTPARSSTERVWKADPGHAGRTRSRGSSRPRRHGPRVLTLACDTCKSATPASRGSAPPARTRRPAGPPQLLASIPQGRGARRLLWPSREAYYVRSAIDDMSAQMHLSASAATRPSPLARVAAVRSASYPRLRASADTCAEKEPCGRRPDSTTSRRLRAATAGGNLRRLTQQPSATMYELQQCTREWLAGGIEPAWLWRLGNHDWAN